MAFKKSQNVTKAAKTLSVLLSNISAVCPQCPMTAHTYCLDPKEMEQKTMAIRYNPGQIWIQHYLLGYRTEW